MTPAPETRIPIKRALLSVYDKTAPGRAGRRPARGRRGARLHRLHRADDRAGGPSGHQGRGPHRLPRVPRRPGQDAAPAGPRGPAGGHGQPRPPRSARRARHRAVPAAGLQPLPVRADGGVRRDLAGDHRADRHRRPGDGPRRRQEPRQRRRRDQPRPVRRRAQGAGRTAASTEPERRRLAAAAYAHTAAYDAAVASWFAASYAPDEVAAQTGWPNLIAQVWTRADALRYGENPHQKAALYTRRSTVKVKFRIGWNGP